MNNSITKIAVVFLARGADKNWHQSYKRFLDSYRRCRPGVKHSLYVIFKGFPDTSSLDDARSLFRCVPHTPVFLSDNNLDIGAYIEWANSIDEDIICMLNTASEILAEDWLCKLALNLAMPNVGLVGATSSYESLNDWNKTFSAFPNIHLRSNAFMIDRKLFCYITKDFVITNKLDAFRFESGPQSMTQKVLDTGQEVLLVGRNGRGYSPKWWPTSGTFRQGTQSNLLVADNQTRNFNAMPWPEKQVLVHRTWGEYIDDSFLLKVKR